MCPASSPSAAWPVHVRPAPALFALLQVVWKLQQVLAAGATGAGAAAKITLERTDAPPVHASGTYRRPGHPPTSGFGAARPACEAQPWSPGALEPRSPPGAEGCPRPPIPSHRAQPPTPPSIVFPRIGPCHGSFRVSASPTARTSCLTLTGRRAYKHQAASASTSTSSPTPRDIPARPWNDTTTAAATARTWTRTRDPRHRLKLLLVDGLDSVGKTDSAAPP